LDLFDFLSRLETRDRLFPEIDIDLWNWKDAGSALAAPREGE
jgi:hypothetical protein